MILSTRRKGYPVSRYFHYIVDVHHTVIPLFQSLYLFSSSFILLVEFRQLCKHSLGRGSQSLWELAGEAGIDPFLSHVRAGPDFPAMDSS